MSLLQDFFDFLVEPSLPRFAGTRVTAPVLGRVVARNTQPFWQERGWVLRGENLSGFYRTRFGAFRGVVLRAMSAQREYRIFDPPRALLGGDHGSCFMARGPREFFVHWTLQPESLDHGIRTIEQYILEALS
ncbi:MAG: hypothetical protein IT434_11730 [Phycisphaerales bacterium]|nr:hypothetical protein [Phycisphaerales bacterium]